MSDRPEARHGALAAAVAAAVVAAFHALWWNRFLGVTTDGWFLVYAEKILAGESPYRDFYMYAPPLHALKLSALVALFGEKLVVIKAWGLAERLAITALLCLWIGRFTAPWMAALATITTMIVFACDVAETVSFYNHDSAYWFVLGGWLTAVVLDRLATPTARRSDQALAAAAGACAAASFLSKQTVGLAALVCLGTLLVLLSIGTASRRRIAGALAAWLLGAAVPLAAVCGWLGAQGALAASFDQTLLGGTAAKGSLASTLLRPVASVFAGGGYGAPAAWAILAIVIIAARRPITRALDQVDAGRRSLYAVLLSAVALLLFSRSWFALGPRMPQLVAVYVAFFGSAAAAWAPGVRWLRGRASGRDRQWLLLCGVGFSVAFSFSISWPAFELMAAPGLAAVLAWASDPADAGASPRWTHSAVVAGCVVWIAAAALFKLQTPFSWGGWSEPPVSQATETPSHPALAGLRLSNATRDAVEEIADRLQRYSEPEDEVFVFPHMPLFYALADRRPASFAITHWFDVAPDDLCQADAERILERPPAVLVMQELSPAVFAGHEAIFRDGQPSGQRSLLAAIGELARGGSYRELPPVQATSAVLRTWVRTTE